MFSMDNFAEIYCIPYGSQDWFSDEEQDGEGEH